MRTNVDDHEMRHTHNNNKNRERGVNVWDKTVADGLPNNRVTINPTIMEWIGKESEREKEKVKDQPLTSNKK